MSSMTENRLAPFQSNLQAMGLTVKDTVSLICAMEKSLAFAMQRQSSFILFAKLEITQDKLKLLLTADSGGTILQLLDTINRKAKFSNDLARGLFENAGIKNVERLAAAIHLTGIAKLTPA